MYRRTDLHHIAFVTALAVVLLSCWGCQGNPLKNEFVEPMQRAHGLKAWWRTKALQMDIKVEFMKAPPFEARFLFETNGGRVRAELADGTVLVFDGEDAWVSPLLAEIKMARFHLLTWPWFVISPMKLGGEGIHLEWLGQMPLKGKPHLAARMTFDADQGDTPDDWYILYADHQAGLLRAQSYIVTYGRGVEEASKEPHAITYDDFKVVNGVTISTAWQLWQWDIEKGIYGEPLGRVKLSNLEFVDPAPDAFAVPEDARRDALPTS